MNCQPNNKYNFGDEQRDSFVEAIAELEHLSGAENEDCA
jgi:hypothetical protein